MVDRSSPETAHVEWTDEDYRAARDCMIGILRGHAWTISDGGRGCQEFDNAFQHAVGILSLRARVAQTAQQWQPIETAPQDGTPVIVWDDPVRGEAYFETGDKAWWWANTGPGDYVGDAIYPTLWQPLPALPDTSTEGK